uniref:Uncharacterized protein n=1 Tax=Anguilla anguilla TaxID=7936 RepID=A0A0E9QS20_ANGAN
MFGWLKVRVRVRVRVRGVRVRGDRVRLHTLGQSFTVHHF